MCGMLVIIYFVFQIVKKEIKKYEAEFDEANPNFMIVTGLANKDSLARNDRPKIEVK